MPNTSDLDDPIATLRAAHRDIEMHIAELEQAAIRLAETPDDAAARAVVADVVAYFDGPVALHHADEEQSLFPLLRPRADLAQMLGALELQHQMNATAQDQLRAAATAAAPELPQLAHRFAEMQRAHILAEERALFPVAAAELTTAELAQLHAEMTARRT